MSNPIADAMKVYQPKNGDGHKVEDSPNITDRLWGKPVLDAFRPGAGAAGR